MKCNANLLDSYCHFLYQKIVYTGLVKMKHYKDKELVPKLIFLKFLTNCKEIINDVSCLLKETTVLFLF